MQHRPAQTAPTGCVPRASLPDITNPTRAARVPDRLLRGLTCAVRAAAVGLFVRRRGHRREFVRLCTCLKYFSPAAE